MVKLLSKIAELEIRIANQYGPHKTPSNGFTGDDKVLHHHLGKVWDHADVAAYHTAKAKRLGRSHPEYQKHWNLGVKHGKLSNTWQNMARKYHHKHFKGDSGSANKHYEQLAHKFHSAEHARRLKTPVHTV